MALGEGSHDLILDPRDLKESELDEDEGSDSGGEVSVGPSDEGGADVHGLCGHDVRVLITLKNDIIFLAVLNLLSQVLSIETGLGIIIDIDILVLKENTYAAL